MQVVTSLPVGLSSIKVARFDRYAVFRNVEVRLLRPPPAYFYPI